VTAAVICSVPLDHKQRDAWTKERVWMIHFCFEAGVLR
jgi:hypothetical protein